MATQDEWIKDGTADAAPVTEATPEVVETPVAAVVEAPAAVAAPIAAATEVPAVPPAEDFIEGRVGDQVFKVPRNLTLPLKRGDEIEYKPVTELQTGGMLEKDYRIKTSETAALRRELDLSQKRFEARSKALESFRQEQIKRLNTIPSTPEEQAKQLALAELSRGDPFFQKLFEDAEKGVVLSAEREVEAQEAQLDQAVAVTNLINNDITRFAEQYQVDADRLRERFAYEITANNAELHPSVLEAIAKQEATYRQSVADTAMSPLQQRLDELQATVASLTAAQAAANHNASTGQAIARAKNPVGAPVPAVGAPAPTPATNKVTGATLAERSSSWASQG